MPLSAPTDVKVTSMSVSGDQVTVNWDTSQNSDSYSLTVKQYTQDFPLATITSSSDIRIALDDANLGTVGSSISSWNSRVGTNHFTTYFGSYTAPTIVQDAVSQRKVVRFDGVDNSLRSSARIGTVTSGNFTIMYVAKTNTATSFRVLQQGNWNTTFGWNNGQVNTMIADTNQGTNTSLAGTYAIPSDTQWRVFTFTAESSPRQFSMRIGGVKRTAGGWLFDDDLVMGGGGGQSGNPTNCDIAALYAWNRLLSEDETLSYEYQLTQKYAIPTATWNSASLVTDLPTLSATSIASAGASDRTSTIDISFNQNYTYYTTDMYGTTNDVNTRTATARLDRMFGFSTTPTKVQSVTATPYDKRVLVSWSAPTSNGGSQITSYIVAASPGTASTTVSGSSTSAIVTGLTNGTSYTFLITPVNINGEGDSEITNAVIPNPTVPFAPLKVETNINVDGDIEVRWLPNSDDGGQPITSYRVTTSPATQTIDVSGSVARYAKITSAAPNTIYTVSVSAINSVGIGIAATATINSITGSSGNTTTSVGDISAVSNFQAGYDTSNNYYVLNWTPPAATNVSYYELRQNNGLATKVFKSNSYIYDGIAVSDFDPYVTDIYTSSTHTIYKYSNGKLRGVGVRHGLIGNNGSIQSEFADISGIDWNTNSAVNVAVATSTTAILLNDGSIKVISSTESGVQDWSTVPFGGAKVVQMTAGQNYVAVVLDNGKVMVRGSNNFGQLAQDNTSNVTVFSEVKGIDWTTKTAASVYAPAEFAQLYIIMTDGSLFFCGRHANDTLGLTTPLTYITMTAVPEFGTTYLAKKVEIPLWSTSSIHILLTNGRIISRGTNTEVMAGVGNTTATLTTWTYMNLIDGVSLFATDIQAGRNTLAITMSDGSIYGTGSTYYMGGNNMGYSPILVYPSTNNILSLSIRTLLSYHKATTSKDVYVYGYNYNSTLGVGTNNSWQNSEIKSISYVRSTPILIIPANRSEYIFTITAVSGTKSSAPVSALVGDLATIPTNVNPQSFGASTLRTTWTASTGIISTYNVYVDNVLRTNVTGTTVDISGLTNLSNNAIKVEAVNQYGGNMSATVNGYMYGAMAGLYYKYNDASNNFSLLWDNQPKLGPHAMLQLTVNGSTQLAPNTTFDNYVYQGNAVRPIKVVTAKSRSVLLMSDGTIKYFNGSDGYSTRPSISSVANVFFDGWNIYYAMNDGTVKLGYHNSTNINTIPNITNMIYADRNLIINNMGIVYNTNGQLYNDTYYTSSALNTTMNNVKLKFVSRGADPIYDRDIFAITTEGLVFSKSTYEGGFALGRDGDSRSYILLSDISNYKAIVAAAGGARAAIVTEDGRVLTCGANNANSIGRIATVSSPANRFNLLPGINNAVHVSCNQDCTLILLSNGRVLGFGNANNGCLANLTGTINTPTDLGLSNIIGIDTGSYWSCFLHADGRVLISGLNDSWWGSFPLSKSRDARIFVPEAAIGTSAISNTIVVGNTYSFSTRYYMNDNIKSTSVTAISAPLTTNDVITTQILSEISVPVRFNGQVVDAPIINNTVVDASGVNNNLVLLADPALTPTPTYAFLSRPNTDSEAAAAIRSAVNGGVNNILVKQTLGSQVVPTLLTTQASTVATPMQVTSPSNISATAAITTTSAGSGNIVAAGISAVGSGDAFVNMYIKVVNSAGSVVSSGFSLPIEITVPGAAARDTIVLQRFNATTGLYEQAGVMTKKAGTSATFQYTLTTNSNYNVVPCILGHTRVITPRGAVAAAFLKVGDNLLMPDGRNVAIRQIYTSSYTTDKDTAPYRFEKGSLGVGLPAQAFEVSPTHAVAVGNNWIIPKYASMSGIVAKQVMVGERVKYYHIELEDYLRDNLLLEGGAVVESFGVNWLKSQPKGTAVYTFDHKSKLFTRPTSKAVVAKAGKAKAASAAAAAAKSKK
jgi:alpha-tubulin suppressor-like RCC1 family protein